VAESVRRRQPNADKIIVIKDGVVAEDGTHTELLDVDGLYAQLHRMQDGRPSGAAGSGARVARPIALRDLRSA
jgi:hypothetical protein